MIAIVYIGESRFRSMTQDNHEQLLSLLRSNWPIQVYDFTHGAWDRSHCPYALSGQIQVWDWYQASQRITENIIIKLRTDIWFGTGAADAVLKEVGNIIDGNQDISYIGSEMYESFGSVYEKVAVPTIFKVQDFCIVADRRRIRSEEAVMDQLTNGKQFKSGNRTWQFLIDEPERAWSVRCQMFLVRNYYQNPTEWQVAYDFIQQFGKCEKAMAWWELKRPKDDQLI